MKRIVLAVLASALLPSLASAQGTINFASDPLSDPLGPNHRILVASTGLPAGAGTFAQLWWAPTQGGTYTNITSLVPVSNTSGRITLGAVATTGTATAGGSLAWVYVYAENRVLATPLVGRTINFQNATGNPNADPPGIPASMSGWNLTVGPIAMTPVVVPEPSTIVLAGLGLASLLIFRRRK